MNCATTNADILVLCVIYVDTKRSSYRPYKPTEPFYCEKEDCATTGKFSLAVSRNSRCAPYASHYRFLMKEKRFRRLRTADNSLQKGAVTTKESI